METLETSFKHNAGGGFRGSMLSPMNRKKAARLHLTDKLSRDSFDRTFSAGPNAAIQNQDSIKHKHPFGDPDISTLFVLPGLARVLDPDRVSMDIRAQGTPIPTPKNRKRFINSYKTGTREDSTTSRDDKEHTSDESEFEQAQLLLRQLYRKQDILSTNPAKLFVWMLFTTLSIVVVGAIILLSHRKPGDIKVVSGDEYHIDNRFYGNRSFTLASDIVRQLCKENNNEKT